MKASSTELPALRTPRFFTTWGAPLLVYAIARSVTAVMLVLLAAEQAPEPPYTETERLRGLGTDPLSLMTYWDGRWYEEIATYGYPDTLPREAGEVVQNAWAFYPLFPALASALMRLGFSFDVAALLLALTLGGAAMLVLYRMLLPRTGAFTALLTVAAMSSAPTSPVFQLAYTEGLALLLVLCSLWALREKRYLLSGGFALALALARPITPALAAVMALLWLLRWRHPDTTAFTRTERVKHASLTAFTGACFVIWPLTCGIATGELDGYAQTQSGWRHAEWGWRTWLTSAFVTLDPGALTVVLVILAGALWLALRRGAAGWGTDLRTWVAVYPLYILTVSQTTTSVFRYLMLTALPAWPLPDVSARIRSGRTRALLLVAVVAIATVLQYFWIKIFFVGFKLYP